MWWSGWWLAVVGAGEILGLLKKNGFFRYLLHTILNTDCESGCTR